MATASWQEKFMQRYYQTVLSIRELTDVLSQYLDEAIYRKNKTKAVKQINSRFVIRDNYLDTTDNSVFAEYPSALLELFVILREREYCRNPRIAIRQTRLHRKLINEDFRNDPVNRRFLCACSKHPTNSRYSLSV